MKTKTLFLCLVISALTLTNCGKKGCTDSNGENYCSDCKKDDGSCTYKGQVVLWTKSLSTGESFDVYLNGSLQGNIGVNFTSAPSCGTTGALTISKELGKNKTQNFSFKVYSDSAGIHTDSATGNILFKANACTAYEL